MASNALTDAPATEPAGVLRLPAGSCDAHVHVFGDEEAYKAGLLSTQYRLPQLRLGDLLALYEDLGISRFVAVQPTYYGYDHGCLLDALSQFDRGTCCGVAIVRDTMSDRELQALHDGGVRSARFNFVPRFGLAPSIAEFRRMARRVSEMGWTIKIFVADELAMLEPELRRIETPVVLDHLGPKVFSEGEANQAAFQLALELLREPHIWIQLSNGDLRSQSGYPFDDIVPFGRALYEAAPDRTLWGTDWPHVATQDHVGLDHTRSLLALVRRYLPDDEAFKRVMVDNPHRLYGFD